MSERSGDEASRAEQHRVQFHFGYFLCCGLKFLVCISCCLSQSFPCVSHFLFFFSSSTVIGSPCPAICVLLNFLVYIGPCSPPSHFPLCFFFCCCFSDVACVDCGFRSSRFKYKISIFPGAEPRANKTTTVKALVIYCSVAQNAISFMFLGAGSRPGL